MYLGTFSDGKLSSATFSVLLHSYSNLSFFDLHSVTTH